MNKTTKLLTILLLAFAINSGQQGFSMRRFVQRGLKQATRLFRPTPPFLCLDPNDLDFRSEELTYEPEEDMMDLSEDIEPDFINPDLKELQNGFNGLVQGNHEFQAFEEPSQLIKRIQRAKMNHVFDTFHQTLVFTFDDQGELVYKGDISSLNKTDRQEIIQGNFLHVPLHNFQDQETGCIIIGDPDLIEGIFDFKKFYEDQDGDSTGNSPFSCA